MRDSNVGKVCVDDLYDLIVVVGEFLKLEIKVVQPGDELRLRRVASDDNKFLGEDSFDDKPAAVMLKSGFAEQLIEADILLFIEPEGVFITRSSELLCVCVRSVFIISVKKAFDSGERPASQSEHLCRTNANLSDKGTARCCLATTKGRGGESLTEVSKILRCSFRGRVGSRCNITTVRYEKKSAERTGADWGGY